MLGLPELDRDPEGRDRKYAAPLHSRSRRGAGGLSQTGEARAGQGPPGQRSPLVLAIDTAGAACSVAVGRGDGLLGTEELAMAHGQAEALLPMVDRVMRAVPLQPAALDIVAATVGPGSFTGIRVGLAAARGIALACGAPLVGVSAFAATAGAVASDRRAGCDFLLRDVLLIALESRRADLFVQLFDPALRPLSEPIALP
ncbi:MAG: tRNA (adenosine(37)-N6)-threonylcarbamoyltransferase complex dimerization subunit type 1 TsaB, partial [Stellaceae bacterium]